MNEKELSEYKDRLSELEDEVTKYRTLIENYRIINDDLKNTIDQIYKSNGWKYLSRYYRWRDKLNLLIPRKKSKPRLQRENNDVDKEELVSIVIPVYNNAKYLEACFDSALNQTYGLIEVIAYDDCSTDKEVIAILKKYSSHPKFKYYVNEINSGISTTMNNAIIKSNGNWIAFLDCDDWLDLNAIEKMMNLISNDSNSVYAYSDRINEFEETGTSKVETFINRPTSNMFDELYKGMYTSHLKIIKKEVFLKIGLHESRFDGAQDYDIALKTAFHYGDSFCYLPEPVYHHRIHKKQTTLESADKIDNIVSTIRNEAQKRRLIKEGKYNIKVSFVILSFEKKEMTLRCVNEIQKTVKVPYEIIIFDNASSEETVNFIKNNVETLPYVKTFYSTTNLGCPGGRREATKLAQGDYIINLDNDIIVTSGWLEELIVRAEQDENVGAVCCKTVFPNGVVQFNGGSYTLENDFITFMLTHTNINENNVETALWLESTWVPGGATLFKRMIINKLDYSPDYVNAFEDNDVAIQIGKLGYKMYNCPAAKVYHYHFMFDETPSKEKKYMEIRYKEESFTKSLVNFYKRNNLIINDQFVFRIMGVEGKSHEEIRERVKQLKNEIFPHVL